MNYDTVDHVLWPYERPTATICEACSKQLSDVEKADPITFDGKVFCDQCGSDVAYLRNEGYIGLVSDKTRKLIKGSVDHFINFLKKNGCHEAYICNFKEQNPLWKDHISYLNHYHPETWLTGAFYIHQTYEGAVYWINKHIKWERELK
jgi:hypothetical protein